jgi:phosphatidate cytidylyltransferase
MEDLEPPAFARRDDDRELDERPFDFEEPFAPDDPYPAEAQAPAEEEVRAERPSRRRWRLRRPRRPARRRAQAPPEPEPESEEAGARRPGLRLPRLSSETTGRVLWAVPWVVFAIVIVIVGGLPFTLAMIALGWIGLREYFRITASARPLVAPAYIVLAAVVLAAHYGAAFPIILLGACSFPLMFFFAAARDSRQKATVSMAFTLLGLAWLGTAFVHAVLLRDLPDHGGALLIDVLVATFLGDTAAYVGGRMFGSRQIAPRISPNKTLEGLLAGFLGGTIGFWFAGLYQDWLGGTEALLMGACVAAIAPIGDLFASLFKRDFKVKDTGRLFGPHGGLIDRLDAVLFTVVAGYYLSVAFVY